MLEWTVSLLSDHCRDLHEPVLVDKATLTKSAELRVCDKEKYAEDRGKIDPVALLSFRQGDKAMTIKPSN